MKCVPDMSKYFYLFFISFQKKRMRVCKKVNVKKAQIEHFKVLYFYSFDNININLFSVSNSVRIKKNTMLMRNRVY